MLYFYDVNIWLGLQSVHGWFPNHAEPQYTHLLGAWCFSSPKNPDCIASPTSLNGSHESSALLFPLFISKLPCSMERLEGWKIILCLEKKKKKKTDVEQSHCFMQSAMSWENVSRITAGVSARARRKKKKKKGRMYVCAMRVCVCVFLPVCLFLSVCQ